MSQPIERVEIVEAARKTLNAMVNGEAPPEDLLTDDQMTLWPFLAWEKNEETGEMEPVVFIADKEGGPEAPRIDEVRFPAGAIADARSVRGALYAMLRVREVQIELLVKHLANVFDMEEHSYEGIKEFCEEMAVKSEESFLVEVYNSIEIPEIKEIYHNELMRRKMLQ